MDACSYTRPSFASKDEWKNDLRRKKETVMAERVAPSCLGRE